MDRREFIKKSVFMFTGAVFVPVSGIWRPKAEAFWGHQTSPSLGGFTSYGKWDETTEAGWGDSVNTFIALFEGGLGADEIGQGAGLSEANRTLTQVGNVAGATGTPPTRDLGNDSQHFRMPDAMIEVMAGQPTWTFITKCKDVTAAAAAAGILRINDTGNDALYMRATDTNETMRVYLSDGGTVRINFVDTANAWNTTGSVWFFAQCNGATTVVGFYNAKPTSLAAIPAGNKVSYAGAVQFDSFDTEDYLFYDNGNNKGIRGYAYYMLFSSKALIGA